MYVVCRNRGISEEAVALAQNDAHHNEHIILRIGLTIRLITSLKVHHFIFPII